MKTFTPIALLLCAALMLAGCGSEPPPAPVPSPDVPAIELPDEPSPIAPPDAPAFDDDPGEPPVEPLEPAAGPGLDLPGEPAPEEPAMDDSAATDGEKPGVTRALGAALLKGVTEGAAGSP